MPSESILLHSPHPPLPFRFNISIKTYSIWVYNLAKKPFNLFAPPSNYSKRNISGGGEVEVTWEILDPPTNILANLLANFFCSHLFLHFLANFLANLIVWLILFYRLIFFYGLILFYRLIFFYGRILFFG